MHGKKLGILACTFILISCLGALYTGCKKSESGPGPEAGEPCPTPSGPTLHSATDITADTTWTAAGSPHIVTDRINIYNNATLTIEPCAEVQLASDVGINVGSEGGGTPGTLRAVGTAQRPIKFTRYGAAHWRSIRVNHPAALAELAFVTLEGGGDDVSRFGATLNASGDRNMPLKKLVKVDHVTIIGSAGVGFNLVNYSGFTDDSQQLVVTQSGASLTYRAAGRITPQGAGTLPSGSYTGNGMDEIVLPTSLNYHVLQSTTWKNLGVPYHVEGIPQSWVIVAAETTGGAAPTLTVDPSVVVKFDPLTSLIIGGGGGSGPYGILNASGNANQSIVFTSAASPQTPGDWEGIEFYTNMPDAQRLNFVRIEYAGGECFCSLNTCVPTGMGDDAAIKITAEIRPSTAFITNSVIFKSALHGIVRNWQSDEIGPDFMPTNTFTDVSGCKQTLHPNALNGCPPNPPCP